MPVLPATEDFQQPVFGNVGEQPPEMVVQACERFGRRAVGCKPAIECLRRRIAGYAPAVRVAVAVEVVFEIGDHEPHLHLQPRQDRVQCDFLLLGHIRFGIRRRAASAAPGESEHLAQLPDGGRALGQDGLHDHVVQRRGVLVGGQRSRTPVVEPVGQPLPADETRLAVEEFPVGAMSFADDGAFPLPGPLLVGEPILRGDRLLDREARNAAPEEGQETPLPATCLDIGRTVQESFHRFSCFEPPRFRIRIFRPILRGDSFSQIYR